MILCSSLNSSGAIIVLFFNKRWKAAPMFIRSLPTKHNLFYSCSIKEPFSFSGQLSINAITIIKINRSFSLGTSLAKIFEAKSGTLISPKYSLLIELKTFWKFKLRSIFSSTGLKTCLIKD